MWYNNPGFRQALLAARALRGQQKLVFAPGTLNHHFRKAILSLCGACRAEILHLQNFENVVYWTQKTKGVMFMRRSLAALLSLLLIFTLLFTACAPAAPPDVLTGPEPTEDGYELSVVTDAPTDETPADVHETSPPTETETETEAKTEAPTEAETLIDENGTYTKKDDVALYIHTYGKLPQNFITKDEAEKLGWTGGSLEPYAPGKCIGGSRFGNYEGLLPKKKGRTYTECDIDTLGKSSRGAKRIVFSNDGLIYYTGDHYEHFTLLYGEE